MTRQVAAVDKDDDDDDVDVNKVKYEFPDAFDELTNANCLFVCGHTYNVGRMKRFEKTWEGKMTGAGKMRFMAYCSSKKDSTKLEWKTDPTIVFQHVHTISRLTTVTQPGRELPFTHDWNMSNIMIVDPPIFLPGGVGQGGRYASAKKGQHLLGPFHELCRFLQSKCTIV